MRTRLWLSLLVVLALVAAACGDDDDGGTTDGTGGGTTAATSGDGGDGVLKVGFAADYGELGSFSDRPATDALRYEVDQINAEGGTQVELVVKNIDGAPEATQRAVQELLDEGVQVIFGPPFSDFGFPLLTQVNGEVPVIFIASTEDSLGNAEQNAFLAAFSDTVQSAAMAEYALGEGYRSAVTFSSPDAPYFTINTEAFATVFEDGGGEVVRDFTFSLADEDFSTQVNQLANLDPQPEVLYTAMIMPQIATLLGQLKGAGVDIAVMGTDAFDATGVVEAGSDAEGVAFAAHTFAEEGSALEQWLAAFEDATGSPIETISFGALAVDALRLAVDAYERAGSGDPADIAAALKATDGFEGLTGEITYAGTNGIPEKPVFVITIEGGELTLATRITPENVPEL
jgi:branched-chain amino acid transport system substrate-binding protein